MELEVEVVSTLSRTAKAADFAYVLCLCITLCFFFFPSTVSRFFMRVAEGAFLVFLLNVFYGFHLSP